VVLEWSQDDWTAFERTDVIEDPVFAVPLPIAALLEVTSTDDAVARALIARRQPLIEATIEAAAQHGREEGLQEGRQEGRRDGQIAGLIEAVLAVLASRGLAVDRVRDQIVGERDPYRLSRWISRAALCTSADELFAEP
jgi:flagellar biosynthesis/type III secretory pathway protein FliH